MPGVLCVTAVPAQQEPGGSPKAEWFGSVR